MTHHLLASRETLRVIYRAPFTAREPLSAQPKPVTQRVQLPCLRTRPVIQAGGQFAGDGVMSHPDWVDAIGLIQVANGVPVAWTAFLRKCSGKVGMHCAQSAR